MTESNPRLAPVILSGGSGTRLWPLSRATQPKQFLALAGETTLFEQTLDRTAGLANSTAPIIVGNAAHRALIQTQAGDAATVILEPCARNTAPAIALAAMAADSDDTLLLVMPSDHIIRDVPAFHAAVARATPLAVDGWLVTFGITPDGPETGYGYIALGAVAGTGAQIVDRFVEKPDEARARAMLEQGDHVWNAGIFLFSAGAFIAALAEHQPAMLAAAKAALQNGQREDNVILPDEKAFSVAPSDSIDYAIMERAAKVACVPVSMGWSDVGSWDALHTIATKDEAGNTIGGDAVLIDTKDCLVRTDGARITLVGAEDLIVVASGGDVLILPRGRSQDVRKAVAARVKN